MSLPTAEQRLDLPTERPSVVSTSHPYQDGYVNSDFLSYCFETSFDCAEFALRADRVGLRGSVSVNGAKAGHVVLRWHRDLGFDVARLEAILVR